MQFKKFKIFFKKFPPRVNVLNCNLLGRFYLHQNVQNLIQHIYDRLIEIVEKKLWNNKLPYLDSNLFT